MKLIRYYWERPSSIHEDLIENGIFTEECSADDVESSIETRKEMCVSENIGRTITKIKIFNFEGEVCIH